MEKITLKNLTNLGFKPGNKKHEKNIGKDKKTAIPLLNAAMAAVAIGILSQVSGIYYTLPAIGKGLWAGFLTGEVSWRIFGASVPAIYLASRYSAFTLAPLVQDGTFLGELLKKNAVTNFIANNPKKVVANANDFSSGKGNLEFSLIIEFIAPLLVNLALIIIGIAAMVITVLQSGSPIMMVISLFLYKGFIILAIANYPVIIKKIKQWHSTFPKEWQRTIGYSLFLTVAALLFLVKEIMIAMA